MQIGNNYAPCFNRIDFVVIAFYIELPWIKLFWDNSFKKVIDWLIYEVVTMNI